MMLNFVPNTVFQEFITDIKGQGLSLVEMQKRVNQECPGADITFQDICRELLEQSAQSSKKQEPNSHHAEAKFACQASQNSESQSLAVEPFFYQLREIEERKKPVSGM